MAPPAGPRGGQVRDQRGVRPRRRLALPAPLQRPVGQHRQRDEDEPGEQDRLGEAHGRGAAWHAVADRGAGRRAGAQRGLAAAQVAGEDPQPVAAGGEHDVVGAGAAQRAADLVALGGGGRGEAVADASLARCRRGPGGPSPGRPARGRRRGRAAARAGRRSRPPSRRGGRAAACSGPSQSRSPRKSETITTSPRWRPSAAALLERAARARSRPRLRPRARGAARPAARAGRSRPWRGRMIRGSPPPNASTPSRLPRRVATWPTASATPSATSALRRSAVPNAIEADDVEHEPGRQRPLADVHAHVRLLQPRRRVPVDVAHVVAREVRADHRQLGARSRSAASGAHRGRALSIRFITARSSERRTAGGTGPGPGLSGVRSGVGQATAPHGSLPPRARPKPGAGQQQHERAAGERRRDLLLLLGLGQPRAEVAVDGGQPAARRRWRRTGRRCRARCPAASAGPAGRARC